VTSLHSVRQLWKFPALTKPYNGLLEVSKDILERKLNRAPPGVTRPMVRFLWSLVATGPHPASNRSSGALVSRAGWVVHQPLPRGGDLADMGARTRPCASVKVTCIVGGAAWRLFSGEAVRGGSNAHPGAVSGTPLLWRARSTPRSPLQRTRATGSCSGGHPRLLRSLPGEASRLRSRADALR